MQFETFDEDLTPTDVAARLLGKAKKGSNLVEQILAANPHLIGLKTIPRGTPVIVPTAPSPDPRLAAAVDRAKRGITDAAARKHALIDKQRTALKNRLALIENIGPNLPNDPNIVGKVKDVETSSKKSLGDLAGHDTDVDARADELRKLAEDAVPKTLLIAAQR